MKITYYVADLRKNGFFFTVKGVLKGYDYYTDPDTNIKYYRDDYGKFCGFMLYEYVDRDKFLIFNI